MNHIITGNLCCAQTSQHLPPPGKHHQGAENVSLFLFFCAVRAGPNGSSSPPLQIKTGGDPVDLSEYKGKEMRESRCEAAVMTQLQFEFNNRKNTLAR
ncbi:uncharacterized protein V6R79_013604 [Siganus canaliculatus]